MHSPSPAPVPHCSTPASGSRSRSATGSSSRLSSCARSRSSSVMIATNTTMSPDLEPCCGNVRGTNRGHRCAPAPLPGGVWVCRYCCGIQWSCFSPGGYGASDLPDGAFGYDGFGGYGSPMTPTTPSTGLPRTLEMSDDEREPLYSSFRRDSGASFTSFPLTARRASHSSQSTQSSQSTSGGSGPSGSTTGATSAAGLGFTPGATRPLRSERAAAGAGQGYPAPSR